MEPETTQAPDNQSMSITDFRREILPDLVTSITKTVQLDIQRSTDETNMILELGTKHGQMELAREAMSANMPVQEFQSKLIDAVTKKQADSIGRQNPNADSVGCSDKEAKRFSILRACRMMAARQPLDGIEGEMNKEVTKKIGRENQDFGFYLPKEVRDLSRGVSPNAVQRAMSAGNFLQGGATVPDQQMDMIELLRNQALIYNLGASRMDDLVGDIVLPRQTSSATITDKSETGTSLTTAVGTDDLKGTPHRLTAFIPVTRQLLAQSSEDVENWMREELMLETALKLDYNALFGNGADGAPMGIFNLSGVGTVTFGAAATRAKLIDFESALNAANALMGTIAYATSPAAAGALRKVKVDAGSAKFLWEGSVLDGVLDNYRGVSSNQVPATGTFANRLILGDWRQLLTLFWAGTEIIVDPYTAKKQGQIEIQIERMYDILVRHPESFVKSTDSAAQ